MFCSTDLCARIWERLESKRAVLFRAPPFSGKTSLSELFTCWAMANLPAGALVVELSLLGSGLPRPKEPDVAEERLSRHWYATAIDARTGRCLHRDWREFAEAKYDYPVVVVVDEGQAAYEQRDNFSLWQYVKKVEAAKSPSYVLVFSSYTEATGDDAGLALSTYASLRRAITPMSFPDDIRLCKHKAGKKNSHQHKDPNYNETTLVFDRLSQLPGGQWLCPLLMVRLLFGCNRLTNLNSGAALDHQCKRKACRAVYVLRRCAL